MPFCDMCGRRLAPDARFCDQCGRTITFELEAPVVSHLVAPPQAPPSYEIVLGETAPRPPTAAREPPAVEQKIPEAQVESKPPESLLRRTEPRGAQPRRIPAKRFHITRRTLALSVASVAVIVVVALAFLGGLITLPPLPGTIAQTASQTVTTQLTGPPLQVEINIASNPVSLRSTQVIVISVRDASGAAVSDAPVRVELLPPSGNNVTSEGLTNADGQYSYSWEIPPSEKIGEFQVTVTATKAGYTPGHAEATFLVWM